MGEVPDSNESAGADFDWAAWVQQNREQFVAETGKPVPTIDLDPDSVVAIQIADKLGEYQQRTQKHPAGTRHHADAACKLVVGERLLETHYIDLFDAVLAVAVAAHEGRHELEASIDFSLITDEKPMVTAEERNRALIAYALNAFNVLQDYVETGGQRTVDGTGL